ncbi:MAG TPA: dihydrolipoyl dehydrogenase [Thermoanaerobaculia bacterium]|nr:dihydrolipoyl dehydrogenase [Thermoanaerobaculia bacterium]HUM30009.1 dihydrolipoyl dehydrogenase [Thermoanaerobaculia bacterium]HXK68302.1 dihydrolipoyl dehydrogenase [Thermoanaerobaculia bacterium]
MVVGSISRGCQVAVIGGGPGGYVAAIRLAQLKKDVILIEQEPSLGGICLNEGCIPSKALIHVADLTLDATQAHEMGVDIGGVEVSMPRLIAWKDSIVSRLTGGVKMLCERNGVEIIHGKASFASDRSLSVETSSGTVSIDFEEAVIATGSSPMPLKNFPLDGETVIGSKEALSLKEVPRRLVIIGAGYVGLELGMVYKKFGAEVSVVEFLPDLLPQQDDDVVASIGKRLEALGMDLYLGHRADRFEKGDPSRVFIVDPDGKEVVLEADTILVSIGRNPNSKDLNLETIGVNTDEKGFITVSDRMESSSPGIYAIGDVIGGPLLAHKAYREAKVAAEVIAGEPSAFDNVVIPAVVYTDPEIAWAGLTEKEARAKGLNIVTGTFPFRASGRALTLNQPEGFVKTIAEAETKAILGVVIVGSSASELVSEAALAIEMGAFLDDLAGTIHPHPTLSEGLLESVEAALNQAIHMVNR